MEYRVIIIFYRRIIIFIQHPVVDQLLDRLLRQIGIDRTGAVSQKRGKMMDFPRFARFQNQRHSRPLLRLYQILVQRGNRQQGGDRHMVFIYPSVG